MEGRIELLGVCGLYCGACNHYRARFPEGKHLLAKAIQYGWKKKGFTCKGCRSNILYIHPGCAQCTIRECAAGRGLMHCGLCSEFPCDRIKGFQNDGHSHHLDVLLHLKKLKIIGPHLWLDEQEERWKCKCGTPFSWYEEYCNNCGSFLDSYGPLPKKKKT